RLSNRIISSLRIASGNKNDRYRAILTIVSEEQDALFLL
ncbi:MAG: hypothetical protein ACI91V_000775, partial [Lentimonas sp.]